VKCEQARAIWHDSIDDGRASDGWTAHVAQCSACRQYEAEMRWIVDGLDDLRRSTEAVESAEACPAEINRPATSARFVRPWAYLLRAAAVIGLVLIGARWLLPGGAPPDLRTPTVPAVVTATASPVHLALTGVSRDELIPVMQRGAPGEPVQVVWLYPTAAHRDASRQP
jgi:hypothetical protein